MVHPIEVLNVAERYTLPTDLLPPELLGEVAEILSGDDLDFDEAWPDGEIVIEPFTPIGYWLFTPREKLIHSGGDGTQSDRTREPPPRKDIYGFRNIHEARAVAAISIARRRKNDREWKARKDNPHWPLNLNCC